MLYRLEFKRENGALLYALETTDFTLSCTHFFKAVTNPDIHEVVDMVDYHDGKGMQEVCRCIIKHN